MQSKKKNRRTSDTLQAKRFGASSASKRKMERGVAKQTFTTMFRRDAQGLTLARVPCSHHEFDLVVMFS